MGHWAEICYRLWCTRLCTTPENLSRIGRIGRALAPVLHVACQKRLQLIQVRLRPSRHFGLHSISTRRSIASAWHLALCERSRASLNHPNFALQIRRKQLGQQRRFTYPLIAPTRTTETSSLQPGSNVRATAPSKSCALPHRFNGVSAWPQSGRQETWLCERHRPMAHGFATKRETDQSRSLL